MSNDKKDKIKFSEKLSLKFRKNMIVDKTKTFLIIGILIASYFALNLWAGQADLPKFDVTENKIYSLTDASKDAIQKINQDVKIYAYGFDEDSSLIGLLKQYNKSNEKITYEILTEETNYDMVKEYELSEGYYRLILKSGDSIKQIDPSSEFKTYDYTTYEQIDVTEQVITNSILGLAEENKPKVYFLEGHEEFSANELAVLNSFLINESFQVDTLNILTTGAVPEDCNILAILSPNKDFVESEVTAIKDYINRGGNIYFSMDTLNEGVSLPNIQLILDEYGVSVENGYIVETGDNGYSQYPYIFMPEVSSAHKITQDIASDSSMVLMYSARLKFKTDEELTNMNITKEVLLNSTEQSKFITDLSSDISTAITNAETSSSDISAILTKNISAATEDTETKTSKLIIVATGNFITDYTTPIDQTYPLSYMGSNKDFVINSMAFLGEKENTLTIRKDMASSTYTPTDNQNIIVIAIVFIIPLLIIIIGIIVWNYRKKRK